MNFAKDYHYAAPVQRQHPWEREQVIRLEAAAKALPAEAHIDIPLEHHFCEGVYARKMTMPADSYVGGKIHLHSQINILSKGHVTAITDKGRVEMFAGDHIVCPEGSKRAFYAHEESVWTVILRCDETDVEKIEQEFVVETEQQYLESQKRIEA